MVDGERDAELQEGQPALYVSLSWLDYIIVSSQVKLLFLRLARTEHTLVVMLASCMRAYLEDDMAGSMGGERGCIRT